MRYYVDAGSWDEPKKKAWYELNHQYRYSTVLHTPTGDETVQVTISCHEESPMTVNVGCTYEGKEYRGHGSDYLWIDAFADLQRKLPKNVLLKCCLTCRHGNLCPAGNEVNELFCTKDISVTQKSDLYFHTEDETERAKRSKQYCSLCSDYQPQTHEHYTYNDFSSQLWRTLPNTDDTK